MSRGDPGLDAGPMGKSQSVVRRVPSHKLTMSDSPHPAINEGYYSLLNDISPTPLPALSPNVMRNVFDNANEVLPEVIVQTLSQGSYLDMPMEWIEALVAAVLWVAKVGGTGNAEPLLDVVLGRVADLCLDYTMAKRVSGRGVGC